MKRIITVLCIAGAISLPVRAFAGDEEAGFTCPERPEKPAKARKSAGALFSDAEQAFDDENYLQALEKFVCSMVMIEHENTAINIERTLDQIDDKAAALPILQTYTERRPNGELKERMDALIAETEAAVSPPPPKDVQPVCPEAAPAPAPPCPPSLAPVLEIETREHAQRLAAVSGWAGIGVGAATFVTAIVMQALAGSAKNRAQSAVDYDIFLDERDKSRSFQTAATTLFVTGVLTSAVGVVELFVLSKQQNRYNAKKQKSGDPKDAAPAPLAPSVSFNPGVGRLELEVRF